jgi:hypothetical protein
LVSMHSLDISLLYYYLHIFLWNLSQFPIIYRKLVFSNVSLGELLGNLAVTFHKSFK